MDRVELLIVQDSFQIPSIGLVLVPDFSLPAGLWKSRAEAVLVETPDGHRFETPARLEVAHFNISGPGPMDAALADRR